MFNELERLRDNPPAQQLLSHYAESGIAAPEEWHERVTELAGVEARLLPRLHGLLIAYGWIEQNTGHTPPPGAAHRCCYRVTEAGILALKQVLSGLADSEDVLAGITTRSAMTRAIRSERRARTRKSRKKARP